MLERLLVLFASMIFLISMANAQEETSEAPERISLHDLSQMFQWDFDSPIRTETVDEGLHVLYGIGGNIAVSIGDDGVLIVDDQFPEMVPKINQAITALGGGKIDFAINTHWHFDHADGNKALGPEGAWIIAQEASTAMMAKDNDINLVAFVYEQKAYPPSARPVISFGERMTMHFNGGDIELVHAGAAHTSGDAAVIFRKQNAVHFGDVFNNTGYPFIDADNGGSIDGMIKFCQSILALIDEDTTIIPGHGEITDVSMVQDYIDMLITVRSRVQSLIDEGRPLEGIQAANVTEDFSEKYGDESMSLGFVNRVYTSLTNR